MDEKQLLEILKMQYGMEDASVEFLREGGGHTYVVNAKQENAKQENAKQENARQVIMQQENAKQKYLAKVIGDAFADTARQSVSVMRYLEENGFPVPKTILTKDGDAFFEMHGDLFVLMEFIDGDEPDMEKYAAEVGELVGRFHQLMEKYPRETVTRGKEFFIGRYLEFLRKKGYPRLADYEELGDRLWEKVGRQSLGICHGDLHRGNLMQSADGKIYLTDFDTICRAPIMFDLMVACDVTNYFNLQPEDVETTKQVWKEFLAGYSKYHALSPEEIGSFPDWVSIRHFQLQATILEIYGIDCIDEGFIDSQLSWLRKWKQEV